mgnify:CR=1 FL=1
MIEPRNTIASRPNLNRSILFASYGVFKLEASPLVRLSFQMALELGPLGAGVYGGRINVLNFLAP